MSYNSSTSYGAICKLIWHPIDACIYKFICSGVDITPITPPPFWSDTQCYLLTMYFNKIPPWSLNKGV